MNEEQLKKKIDKTLDCAMDAILDDIESLSAELNRIIGSIQHVSYLICLKDKMQNTEKE